MGAAAVNIINPDGTIVAVGGISGSEEYTRCFISAGEYSDEYQGASKVELTVKCDRQLPVYIGARIFAPEEDGAGGYILLSPPEIERITHNHFIYTFTFWGAIHLLETKLLFNQDLKGDGWNLTFPLVGTATDFLTLICTNMNRTLPVADQIVELWQVGTVDDITSQLLIDFDNDNCLTALKKVSDAFRLPYRVSVSETADITLDLSNECRIHSHIFKIGEGLSKFKVKGDNDRPFATALHVLGGMQNIPYDYREGSRRLRTASGEGVMPDEEEVIYDDGTTSGSWTASKENVVPGVTVQFNSTNAVYHGSSAMRIYHTSGGNINDQKIKIEGGPFNASGGQLYFHLYLEPDDDTDFRYSFIMVYLISVSGTTRIIMLQPGMYGYSRTVLGSWQTIKIPVADFGLSDANIDTVKFWFTWSWPAAAKVHLDYVRINVASHESLSFLWNEDDIGEHGRIEAVTINEDIYPKSDFAITSVVSIYKFIDTSLFDLNEKDEEGNTLYLIDGVTPKVTFTSGNLSGYSFAIKAFDSGTKEIELVPYTDDLDNEIPSAESEAFQFATGDKYVITEIRMPDEYMEDAEDDLLAWGQSEYAQFSAHNEVAEIEIDPVWVKQVTDLKYTLLGDDPPVEYDIDPLVDLFMAGDLLTIFIEGLYSRQLRVLTVAHQLFSGNAVWKVTLGNNTNVNLAGKLVGDINTTNNRLNNTLRNLKLVKYYTG